MLCRVSEGDKLRLKKDGFGFMDVTDYQDLGEINAQRLITKAIKPLQVNEERKLAVRSMFPDLDTTYLKEDITKLSSFWTRNYRSQWGLLSSNWIYDQVDAVCSFAASFKTDQTLCVSPASEDFQ